MPFRCVIIAGQTGAVIDHDMRLQFAYHFFKFFGIPHFLCEHAAVVFRVPPQQVYLAVIRHQFTNGVKHIVQIALMFIRHVPLLSVFHFEIRRFAYWFGVLNRHRLIVWVRPVPFGIVYAYFQSGAAESVDQFF